MKLSAPVYSLKRLAKNHAKQDQIPLHAALDQVAQKEGYENWSLLASRLSAGNHVDKLLAQLIPGELILLGARPGHGKTLMGVELVAKTVKSARHGWFFTLEWNFADIESRLDMIGEAHLATHENFHFDNSDAISASYIIEQLDTAQNGTVVVIDYLQLLDQKRTNAELSVQINDLKKFANRRGVILVILSQIHRSYEATARSTPTLNDVRLPNPLDLSLFNRTCFLHDNRVRFS